MIVITGANGQLGRLVVQTLLRKMPASEIVAAVRDPGKARDLTVQVREADYERPETLARAFKGAAKVLLISSSEVGRRVPQHTAAIDTAREAGVELLAYTSVLKSDSATFPLVAEHKPTEAHLRASGLPFVLLRNGWYFENQTGFLAPSVEHGAVLGAAGEGRFASASRADYAEAAVAVLTGEGPGGKTYELAGDSSYTLAELAAEAARRTGKPVQYQDLPEAAYAEALTSMGLPKGLAQALAGADAAAARGELDSSSRDLSRLIGRPTTSLAAAVSAALQG